MMGLIKAVFCKIFISRYERDRRFRDFLETYIELINKMPKRLANEFQGYGKGLPIDSYTIGYLYHGNIVLNFNLEDVIWFVKFKDDIVFKETASFDLAKDIDSIINLYNSQNNG